MLLQCNNVERDAGGRHASKIAQTIALERVFVVKYFAWMNVIFSVLFIASLNFLESFNVAFCLQAWPQQMFCIDLGIGSMERITRSASTFTAAKWLKLSCER